MNIKKTKYLLVLIVSMSPLLSGCGGTKEQPRNRPTERGAETTPKNDALVSVDVTEVKGIKYSERIELPGSSVHGMETTQLFSRVGGYVSEIKKVKGKEIDIGTLVTKDMEIALISVPELNDELSEKKAKVLQADKAVEQAAALVMQRKAEVDQVEARKSEKQALLNLQKIKLDRVKGLVKTGSIGKEHFDEAQYAVNAAQAALDSVKADKKAAEAIEKKAVADQASASAKLKVAQAIARRAQTMVNFAIIRAPFDGIITRRHVDHGAFVRPATNNSGAMPLFEISRIDKVRVVASVPNTHASRVLVGQRAMFFSIGGLPGVGVAEKISRSSNTLDRKSRMMRIDIEFTNPVQKFNSPDKVQLKPGMYGTVSVSVKDWKSLPVVPVSALLFDEMEQSYVMVVNGKVCQKRSVTVVFNNAKTVGIATGVRVGESIVSNGAGKLKDQQKITIKSK